MNKVKELIETARACALSGDNYGKEQVMGAALCQGIYVMTQTGKGFVKDFPNELETHELRRFMAKAGMKYDEFDVAIVAAKGNGAICPHWSGRGSGPWDEVRDAYHWRDKEGNTAVYDRISLRCPIEKYAIL